MMIVSQTDSWTASSFDLWFCRWFERLLVQLGFEVWIGNAAEIKTPGVCCRTATPASYRDAITIR
jgi:hypothetical protein